MKKCKNILCWLFAFIIFSNCQAQEKNHLLNKDLVADLSQMPIYPRLVEERDGDIIWKEKYQYLDSIEIYKIVYLSDGLKINGYLVQPSQAGKYPWHAIDPEERFLLVLGERRRTVSLRKPTPAALYAAIANE